MYRSSQYTNSMGDISVVTIWSELSDISMWFSPALFDLVCHISLQINTNLRGWFLNDYRACELTHLQNQATSHVLVTQTTTTWILFKVITFQHGLINEKWYILLTFLHCLHQAATFILTVLILLNTACSCNLADDLALQLFWQLFPTIADPQADWIPSQIFLQASRFAE